MAGIIIIAAKLFNMSPWGMLSGLGAMTALVVLIFRDWILGLIASIQINANNLVVMGDSIEMEKYGVNGEVIEISLSTVKVKNWDNTISMIPAYSLISETFKNWHGVKESGGRRLKRVIYIDMTSITHPDAKTVKKIGALDLLKKTDEFKDLQKSSRSEITDRINASGLTNIGIFRKYVELYMSGHPGINSERTLMAKLLEPTSHGIPLQLYAFTTLVDVVQFERELAEIVEHLIAVLPVFGLRLFQNPSGTDLRYL
jgi:miniconductance mechanosensitive channel